MCPSLLPQGAVITPAAAIEPSLSLHPSSVMTPLTQQMNHLSLGTTGAVSVSLYHLQTILLHLYVFVCVLVLSCNTFNIISK